MIWIFHSQICLNCQFIKNLVQSPLFPKQNPPYYQKNKQLIRIIRFFIYFSQQIQQSIMNTPQLQSIELQNISSLESSKKKDIQSQRKSIEVASLAIPLISKRMNFVEKYIKEFGDKSEKSTQLKKESNNLTERLSINRSISPSDNSIQIKQFNQGSQPEPAQVKQYQFKSCLKYQTIRDQSSEDRIESLGKIEAQYLRLKEKSHLPNKLLPNIANKRPEIATTISHDEVQRQIKKSIITQGGQRYFADLYLMKKGRDKIITSLSTVGKHTLGNHDNTYEELIKNSLTYQDQVAASKHEYVKKKILDDRTTKKDKMLRGRSMNWNVYYEILALSARERKNLKGADKFQTDYGVN